MVLSLFLEGFCRLEKKAQALFGRSRRPESLGCFVPLGALHARSRVAWGNPGGKAQEAEEKSE